MHGCGAYEWQIEVRKGWLGNLKDCTYIYMHLQEWCLMYTHIYNQHEVIQNILVLENLGSHCTSMICIIERLYDKLHAYVPLSPP